MKISNLILIVLLLCALNCSKKPTEDVFLIHTNERVALRTMVANDLGIQSAIYDRIKAGDIEGALDACEVAFSCYERKVEILKRMGIETAGLQDEELFKNAVNISNKRKGKGAEGGK